MDRKDRVSGVVVKHYDRLKLLFLKYNILEVRIFGSIARNTDTESSDIDFLIKLSENSTLIDYGQLRYELEELLQVPIDMLTYSGLNPPTLEYFINNSIMLDQLPNLTTEAAIEEKAPGNVLVQQNLNSAVWVIDRILESCNKMSKDEFMNNEAIQDAVTRNMQLLGKVLSQIPKQEIDNLQGLNTSQLKGCITLKEALFMNVDYVLLWNTIFDELKPLKHNIKKVINERDFIA